MAQITLAKGINTGLRAAMEADPKVLLMGEDIGKLGGVFRVTDGLQKDFGEDRVIDAPLAESGIVGTAIGMALRGYRPVCEIQFDGFVYPAFDQIVSQLAKMRARSLGAVKLPVVIRIPVGGGIGAVEHHSESNEAYFAHTAGLRVVCCADPVDAHFMIQQAIASDDPVIFYEPKRRYWEKAELPEGLEAALPVFPADAKGVATRAASGKVINAIADIMPELWGGSADLAGSNNTTIAGAKSFIPASRSTHDWSGDPYQGRVLHFGIREHAMGAIINGIAVHGGTRVYGATFLQFSDYMRGAVRVGALMKAPSIWIWTHDSVGLGEDGPTHQPVEHLWALRAIPGLDVVRPADANETAAAWLQVLKNSDRPAGLILSRQNLPTFPRGEEGFATTEHVGKGGYVLIDAEGGEPDVILIGTGSEVQLAVAAREQLKAEGINARVVSMPSIEWFEQQTQAYRDQVLLPGVKARVSVEAGIRQGWREYVGDNGRMVSLEHYGASADGARIFKEFGFTAEAVAQAARDSLEATRH